jgi:hypothetical protein
MRSLLETMGGEGQLLVMINRMIAAGQREVSRVGITSSLYKYVSLPGWLLDDPERYGIKLPPPKTAEK